MLDKARKGTLLRECGDLLKMHRVNMHHSIVYILHARVPIISFRDSMFRKCGALGMMGESVELSGCWVFKCWNMYTFWSLLP